MATDLLGQLSENARIAADSVVNQATQRIESALTRGIAQGPLRSLSGSSYPGTYSYPLNYGDGYPTLQLRLAEYDYDNRYFIPIGDTKATIILPLPANLSTAYSVTYNNQGLGAFGRLGAEGGAAAAETGDFAGFIDNLANRIGGVDREDILKQLGMQFLQSEFGTVAAGYIAGGVVGAGAAAGIQNVVVGGFYGAGIAVNPNEAQIFSNVNFRTHNFEYKMIARNKQESDAIYRIINLLKFAMLPRYIASNHIFKYPWQFDLSFSYDVRNYLFDIGTSVLTDLSINYHGEGGAYYFDRGWEKAPVNVTIGMQFTETTIVTKEDIYERPASQGGPR